MSTDEADWEMTDWETKAARALDGVPAELGPVVRAARELEGLGVRELARRAGVSESQISRIENGKTKEPGSDALSGIADALGRSRMALFGLAGPWDIFVSASDDIRDALPGWIRKRHQDLDFAEVASRDEVQAFARDVFLGIDVWTAMETLGFGLTQQQEFQEIMLAWFGLTADRQARTLEAFRDQLRLSELDRRTTGKDGAR